MSRFLLYLFLQGDSNEFMYLWMIVLVDLTCNCCQHSGRYLVILKALQKNSSNYWLISFRYLLCCSSGIDELEKRLAALKNP